MVRPEEAGEVGGAGGAGGAWGVVIILSLNKLLPVTFNMVKNSTI
ncbi:hypothetical protein PL11201_660156 [Planktothrix sp. PCC 11201]|nr:hypothetical protein PL11201_660156 [Planktothrix sp. PCC 11201]